MSAPRRPAPGRAGVAVGDALLALSVMALIAAAIYPRLARRAVDQRVASSVQAVRTLRDGAFRFHAEQGTWPPGGQMGVPVPELAPYLPADFAYRTAPCALGWDLLDTVVLPEEPTAGRPEPLDPSLDPEAANADTVAAAAPRVVPLGAVTARCSDLRILPALQDTFGVATSFIRGGDWTLVLPGSDEARP